MGCDGILGSVVVEDFCGVCNGDNSSCYTVNGTYDKIVSPGSEYIEESLVIHTYLCEVILVIHTYLCEVSLVIHAYLCEVKY